MRCLILNVINILICIILTPLVNQWKYTSQNKWFDVFENVYQSEVLNVIFERSVYSYYNLSLSALLWCREKRKRISGQAVTKAHLNNRPKLGWPNSDPPIPNYIQTPIPDSDQIGYSYFILIKNCSNLHLVSIVRQTNQINEVNFLMFVFYSLTRITIFSNYFFKSFAGHVTYISKWYQKDKPCHLWPQEGTIHIPWQPVFVEHVTDTPPAAILGVYRKVNKQ